MKPYVVHIIDDDPLVASILEKRLQSIAGLNICKFLTVSESLGSNDEPSLIILDHNLGNYAAKGVDSIPVIKGIFKSAMIIILSSQMDLEVYQKSYEYGASYYFKKSELVFLEIEQFIRFDIQHGKNKKSFWANLFKEKKKQPLTIVTIDFNLILSSVLQFRLYQNFTASLHHFENSQKAIDCEFAHSPDVVLLDHKSNSTGGLEWIDKLKKKFKGSKIIILSDEDSLDIALAYQMKGIKNFIVTKDNYIDKIVSVLEQN